MWFLYKLNDSNENTDDKILIRPGKEYTIGRKGTSIIFQDKSVSRSHAKISVGLQTTRDTFEANYRPLVKLVDNNSKYGSFINAQSVTTELELADADIIKFGSLNSALRLVWKPVVICIPSMTSRDKSVIANLAIEFGATLAKEWDDKCTHLYMKNIEIKAKLLLCLISACHVISLQWFEALVAQEDTSFSWPAESNYLPPIPHDVTLRKDDCVPNLDRSALFTDLEFWIFDEEQFNRYTPIIEAAKGKAKSCSFSVLYRVQELCAKKRLIVAPPEEHNEKFIEVEQKLKKKNKRPIKGDEISDAIIKCSTEEVCNATAAVESDDEVAIVSNPSSPVQSFPVQSPAAHPSPNVAVHTPSDMSDIFDDMLGDPDPIVDTSSVAHHSPSQNNEIDDGPNSVPILSPSAPVAEDDPEPEPTTPRQRGSRRRLPLRSQVSETMNDQSTESRPNEEANVDIPIVPGKRYTAILCSDILCPAPPVRRPAPEDTGRVNFKKFRKVDSANPRGVMDFIPTALTEADNHALREYYAGQDEAEGSAAASTNLTPGEDDPFADIRIQVNNVRRQGGRSRR